MTTPGFQPLVAGHDGREIPRFRFDQQIEHDYPCAPVGGGWTPFGDVFEPVGVFGSGSVRHLRPTTANVSTLVFPLIVPNNRSDTYGTAPLPLVIFTRFRLQYRLPATDTLEVWLIAQNRSNGQTTVVDSWTSTGGSPDFPTAAGTFSSVAFVVSHTLDPATYAYSLHLEATAAGGGGLSTSVAVANADYRLKTTGLLGS